MQTENYTTLLYYGVEECESECAVFHSFRAVDPSLPHDDDQMAKILAQDLGCDPEDDNFQSRSMIITLPQSQIRCIKDDAIRAYFENMDAKRFIAEHPQWADAIFREVRLQYRMEDVAAALEEEDMENVSNSDIRKLAVKVTDVLSKNDAYAEAFNETVEQVVAAYLEKL